MKMEEADRYAEFLVEENRHLRTFEIKLLDREQFNEVAQALEQRALRVEKDENALFLYVELNP